MPSTQKRQSSYRFGLLAEAAVILYLRVCGYKILNKRYKTKVGEIDIIARKKKQIIFIEVKARRKEQDIYEVLSSKQQHRITRAASLFLARNKRFAGYKIRFDLITVSAAFRVRHMKNLW